MNQARQYPARAPLAELHLFALVSSQHMLSRGPDGEDLNAKSTTAPWKELLLKKLSLSLTQIPRK